MQNGWYGETPFWSIVGIARLAITLQLLGLFGFFTANEHTPPPFVGNFLFQLSTIIIPAFLLGNCPVLR